MIVVEGPKAGGHLGFHRDELEDIDSIDYDGEFIKILEITKEYGQKYDKEIPVIAAGGISTSSNVVSIFFSLLLVTIKLAILFANFSSP